VLVDAGTADDAAVYRLGDDRALVATVDFFTPIVDDPYDFGRIAAANALSDVYAMGGRPLFALNLVGFPRDLLRSDPDLLGEILRGGGDVVRAAGAVTVGGHSIDDAEPKYGLCVIGEVDPAVMTRNATARAGDRLVLTKPIGTGIIATAIKRGAAADDEVAGAVASMTTLNRAAADAAARVGVSAATDVTGFGLIGHLRALLRASGAGARISAAAVPLLPGAERLARDGCVPGGTRRNLEDAAADVHWEDVVDDTLRLLLCDAQTSGGLLFAVPADRVDRLIDELEAAGTLAAARIGVVVGGPAGSIEVAS
jgi:selenide, water dikinase